MLLLLLIKNLGLFPVCNEKLNIIFKIPFNSQKQFLVTLNVFFSAPELLFVFREKNSYFNLQRCCAQDVDASKIPVTIGGFEL